MIFPFHFGPFGDQFVGAVHLAYNCDTSAQVPFKGGATRGALSDKAGLSRELSDFVDLGRKAITSIPSTQSSHQISAG